jgi:hypothetical protein
MPNRLGFCSKPCASGLRCRLASNQSVLYDQSCQSRFDFLERRGDQSGREVSIQNFLLGDLGRLLP